MNDTKNDIKQEGVVRTRFAPSPTGYMHIGNLRTALYCYLISRKLKGKFVLRIEDTDRNRFVDDAEQVIYDTMKICGLDYDEGPNKEGEYGPYKQSQRFEQGLYMHYAKKLIESGDAYYCFCGNDENENEEESENNAFAKYDRRCLKLSKEEIENNLKNGKPFVIRQKIPEGKTSFVDTIYGTIEVDNSELEDMILIKSDGYPTYNFANIVDDHLMNITHIVRGMEYLSSTPKYSLLYKALGWQEPIYIHCPHITDEEHKKLSKRLGHASVNNLLKQGFLPQAIINYIALLGWSPEGDKEFFTLEELIDAFDYKKINKSNAVFDLQKFKWMNGEYYKAMPIEEFTNFVMPQLEKYPSQYDKNEMADLLHTRIECFEDIDNVLDFVLELPDYTNEIFENQKLKVTQEIAKDVLIKILPILEKENDYSKENITNVVKDFIAEQGVKNGVVLWPLRAGLSGKMSSAGGAYELFAVFGKDESLRRIKIAIEKLSI